MDMRFTVNLIVVALSSCALSAQEIEGPTAPESMVPADAIVQSIEREAKRLEDRVYYTIPGANRERMSVDERVASVYARQLDVGVSAWLVETLVQLAPGRIDLIEKIFEERIDARDEDEPIIESLKGVPLAAEDGARPVLSEKEIVSKIRVLEERERVRTRQLSASLSRLLSPEEETALNETILSRRGFQSMSFPLVAEHLGLESKQVREIQDGYQKYIDVLQWQRNAERRGETFKDQRPKLVADLYDKLTLTQTRRLLSLQGKLADGESLTDAVETFPPDARPYLKNIFAKKADAKLRR